MGWGTFAFARFFYLDVACDGLHNTIRNMDLDDEAYVGVCTFVPFWNSEVASAMLSPRAWQEIRSHNEDHFAREENQSGYAACAKFFKEFAATVKPSAPEPS